MSIKFRSVFSLVFGHNTDNHAETSPNLHCAVHSTFDTSSGHGEGFS